MKKAVAKRAGSMGPDAIVLLKDDHRTVSKMFGRYDKLGDSAHTAKLKLARTICRELKVHTRIEEEIFYPAIERVLPQEKDLGRGRASGRQEAHRRARPDETGG